MTGWQATVLTLFPEMFPGPLGISLLGKGLEKNLWSLEVCDIRDHGLGKHRTVDDTPAGGGFGMVMRADVAAAAIDAVDRRERPLIYLSPRGAPLTQSRVQELAAGPGAVLLCGRFRGSLDQRVIEARNLEEISLGDFVLAGGEVAAMALIEASVRLLPGVLGDLASTAEEKLHLSGLLEYPHYTRPQLFEDRPIPDVLTGGNHLEISKFRQRPRRRKNYDETARRPRPLGYAHEKRKAPEMPLQEKTAAKAIRARSIAFSRRSPMNLLQQLEAEQMAALRAKKLPDFRPGDTLKVNVKVVDVTYDEKAKQNKTRERIQAFEGVCIARQGAGLNEAFTVRKLCLWQKAWNGSSRSIRRWWIRWWWCAGRAKSAAPNSIICVAAPA